MSKVMMMRRTKIDLKNVESSPDVCSDCGIKMNRSNSEYSCPKCGMVKDILDGAL